MGVVSTGIQVILAAIFSVAAVGKFRDLPGSRRAVADFGVPPRFAGIGGIILPAFELALAFALLFQPTVRGAALLSSVLLLAFIAAIGWNLSQGRRPDCHCFGQIHSEPAGWPAIGRNVALALGAALVVRDGGHNPVGWIAGLSAAAGLGLALGLAALIVAVAQGWLLVQLTRQNERILARIERVELTPVQVADADMDSPGSLATGHPAPEFNVPDQDGRRMSLAGLLNGGVPTLLVFSDPGCGPCNALMPDIGEWQRRYANEVRVALISRGSQAMNLARSAEHGISRVGIQHDREVDDLYDVTGTPTGILVQPDGMIRHQAALGPGPVRALFSLALTNQQRARFGHPQLPADEPGSWDDDHPLAHLPTALEIGAPAPALPLRDLEGNFSGIEDYRGREAAVVFMSPSCIFSQRMLPDLHEWAREAAGDVLQRLVIVTEGTAEENGQLGLPGRVLLDEGFTLGRAFGASGTPAAAIIDGKGRLAAPLATGEDAVLDLLYAETLHDGGATSAGKASHEASLAIE